MRRALYLLIAAAFAGYAYAAWRADSTAVTADMTDHTADGFAPAQGGGGSSDPRREKVAVSIAIGVGQ